MTDTGHLSNNCTLWPDGVPVWLGGSGQEWTHCCRAHDLAYDAGSSKLLADLNLLSCVADSGFPFMGTLMGIAVILLGYPFYKRRASNANKRISP